MMIKNTEKSCVKHIFIATGCFSVFIFKMISFSKALGCSPSKWQPLHRLANLIAKIETTCTYCSKACATPILVMGLFPLRNRGFLMIMYYIGDYVLANMWSLKKYRSIIYLLTMCIALLKIAHLVTYIIKLCLKQGMHFCLTN